MARRKFLHFSRAKIFDQQMSQRYLLSFHPSVLYHSWHTLPALTSPQLFANDFPLELEIGCGDGAYLCALATKAPDKNFLGIDISSRELQKAVALAASLELQNIRFINADCRLIYPLLRPDSLNALYLHFPDPHLKPGCQPRRLLNQAFLDAASQALIKEGRLSVMTDVESFFMDMLQLVEQDNRFVKIHAERYLIGFEPEVKSRFQVLWERHGELVFRFEVRKSGSVS